MRSPESNLWLMRLASRAIAGVATAAPASFMHHIAAHEIPKISEQFYWGLKTANSDDTHLMLIEKHRD